MPTRFLLAAYLPLLSGFPEWLVLGGTRDRERVAVFAVNSESTVLLSTSCSSKSHSRVLTLSDDIPSWPMEEAGWWFPSLYNRAPGSRASRILGLTHPTSPHISHGHLSDPPLDLSKSGGCLLYPVERLSLGRRRRRRAE